MDKLLWEVLQKWTISNSTTAGGVLNTLGNEEIQKIKGTNKSSKQMVARIKATRTRTICSLEFDP